MYADLATAPLASGDPLLPPSKRITRANLRQPIRTDFPILFDWFNQPGSPTILPHLLLLHLTIIITTHLKRH